MACITSTSVFAGTFASGSFACKLIRGRLLATLGTCRLGWNNTSPRQNAFSHMQGLESTGGSKSMPKALHTRRDEPQMRSNANLNLSRCSQRFLARAEDEASISVQCIENDLCARLVLRKPGGKTDSRFREFAETIKLNIMEVIESRLRIRHSAKFYQTLKPEPEPDPKPEP